MPSAGHRPACSPATPAAAAASRFGLDSRAPRWEPKHVSARHTSTRLRLCNKVYLACAGYAQSCSGDAGSLVSTSEAAGVTIDLCFIRLCFTVHACVGAALASPTRRRRLSMRAHPRRRRSQPACGGDQVTGLGCDTGESSSGTEDALQVIPATHGARYMYQCAITLLDPILAGPLRM